MKILIIEDNAQIQELYTEIGEEKIKKQELVFANTGADALKKTKKEKFDIILVDLSLPDMDGLEVLKELKKQKHTANIYAITNLSNNEAEQKAKTLGAKKYLIKAEIPLLSLKNLFDTGKF